MAPPDRSAVHRVTNPCVAGSRSGVHGGQPHRTSISEYQFLSPEQYEALFGSAGESAEGQAGTDPRESANPAREAPGTP
ncbi:hypothetical protein KRM28CT15_20560 [Krasilnikovia sp. M28-CT-15]